MSLANKTILITRTKKQAASLIEMLENYGCTVLNVPTIKITDPENPEQLQHFLHKITAYDKI